MASILLKYRLTDYWINKLTLNRKRDRKNRKILKNKDWTVLRVWDDDIKKNPKREINKILKLLNVKIDQ